MCKQEEGVKKNVAGEKYLKYISFLARWSQRHDDHWSFNSPLNTDRRFNAKKHCKVLLRSSIRFLKSTGKGSADKMTIKPSVNIIFKLRFRVSYNLALS